MSVLWTALQSALALVRASRKWMQPLDCLWLVGIVNWEENVESGKHRNRSLLWFFQLCLSRSWAQQLQFWFVVLTLQMGRNPEGNLSLGQAGRAVCSLLSWMGLGWGCSEGVPSAGGSTSSEH